MLSNRFRSLLSLKKFRALHLCRSLNAPAVNVEAQFRVNKRPIKPSMYAYKRLQTTYYDWMEAVNRVDVPREDFHRPLIIRATVRQILRFMHDGYIATDQWTSFRDYLVKKDIGVSRLFDGIFLHECLNHFRFLMALSYVHHLQNEHIPLTPTGLAMLMLLARQIDIRPELHEYALSEETIWKTYEEFLSHHHVPDSMLALPIIAGLTLTSRWKEALKYLPILDNDLDGMQEALGFVLGAAARFHDYPFFFSLLDNISQTESIRLRQERERIREKKSIDEPRPRVALEHQVRRQIAPSRIKESDYYLIAKTSEAYETFTNYLTGEHQEQIDILKKLLEKTAMNGYIPPKSFVQALEKKLKELDPRRYQCDYIYFYPNGQSLDGKSKLRSIALNSDESESLHRSIQTQFQSLLELHCPKTALDAPRLLDQLAQPFDVLFDCLHYPSLELDWKIRHPLYIKRILYQIVDEKGKRCLAIAKVDLADYIESLQLPSDLLSIVRVPYESVKSPLPLLSALYHHPSTLLASPLDQRSYKSVLGLDQMELLDRWIQTHQLIPIAKPDLVYLQAPYSYSTRVHLNENEWLIPYFDGSPLTEVESVLTWFRVQIQSNE